MNGANTTKLLNAMKDLDNLVEAAVKAGSNSDAVITLLKLTPEHLIRDYLSECAQERLRATKLEREAEHDSP